MDCLKSWRSVTSCERCFLTILLDDHGGLETSGSASLEGVEKVSGFNGFNGFNKGFLSSAEDCHSRKQACHLPFIFLYFSFFFYEYQGCSFKLLTPSYSKNIIYSVGI